MSLRRLVSSLAIRTTAALVIGHSAFVIPCASAAPFPVEEATIAEIQAAYLAGKTTAREVTQAYLDRIAAYDQQGPMLNSLITINARVLAEADRLDAALKATGKLTGPLHGIPVIAKDNIDTGDLPTSGGSASLRTFQPGRDATAIARMRAAGAILIAKASLAEFANGGFDSINSVSPGYIRNPYHTAYASGGSSGGTGVALAANFAVTGLGTDTGISVRAPASINSVVGLRPTHGLISLDGVMPLNVKWDTVGPMARTVRDLATLLDVVAGPDPLDPISQKSTGHVPASYTAGLKPGSLQGKRIGVLRQIFPLDKSDPRVVALLDQTVADLRKAGATVIDPLPVAELPGLTRDWKGYTRLRDDFDAYLAKHPTAPFKSFKEIVESRQYLGPRFEKAFTDQLNYPYPADKDPTTAAKDATSEAVRQAFLKAFDSDSLDALIFPQFNYPPKKNGDTFTPLGRDQNLYSSITGFPALVVPMGFVPPGLPLGVQFFGRPWSEATLLEIGYGYEKAAPHRVPPPTTPPLADSLAAKFIGVWKLVAIRDRDTATGVETPAARGAHDGQLLYAANGRMSVQIIRVGRDKTLGKADADGFSSYLGTWKLMPAEGYVIHQQDGNLNQAQAGQAAPRYYSFDKKGWLSLATPPRKRDSDGKEVQSVFVWEKYP